MSTTTNDINIAAAATLHNVASSVTNKQTINIGFSREISIFFELLVLGVMVCVLGLLGLVGNLLSIFILTRRQMKGSTHFILMALASSDSIVILTR